MESEEPGHEEYRYNIGPIEHDPFILISYLSAKYEEFTFEQVKPELDALFALQYRLETEAVNETVTETATVRVGESLGQVVTSGYCNCPICCGIWSGGPTASGAYPTAKKTVRVMTVSISQHFAGQRQTGWWESMRAVFFSVLYNQNLKVGRVQTPTLAMIVDRNQKIKEFTKEKYYMAHIKFDDMDAVTEHFQKKKEDADKVAADCMERM